MDLMNYYKLFEISASLHMKEQAMLDSRCCLSGKLHDELQNSRSTF